MNAAIRAVTRSAIYAGMKVYGIYRGWEGLINGEIKEFTTESVSNTIQRGGTILKTTRSEAFRTVEDSTGIQTLVAVVGDIDPDDCFEFTHQLAEKVGVGRSSSNNGLVILLSTARHH